MNITSGEIDGNVDAISTVIEYFKNTYPVALWKTFGLFDEDFIKTINIHWLKFPPPHKANYYILTALYVLIMIAGWCGNAFVLIVFLKRPSLRTPANVLVMNLAISDLLMMLKMPILIFNSIHLGPALGKTGCHIFGFVGGLSGTVSICTLTAISLERYYVIKFPLNMRFTRFRAKICVAIAWCYSAIFSGLPLLNLNLGSFVPEGYLISCSFDYLSQDKEVKIFIFVFFVAAWVVPFLLITFCYVNILQTVLKAKKITRRFSEASRHIRLEVERRQEIKLAGTVFLIIALWFAAWTPYSVVALLGILNRADLITPLASIVPTLFCKTASCIDPFVYAITNPKFKSEVCKLCSKNISEQTPSSRIWTTKATINEDQLINRRNCYMHSCQSSDEVEEEMITVNVKINDRVGEQKLKLPSCSQQDVI